MDKKYVRKNKLLQKQNKIFDRKQNNWYF